MWYCLHCGHEFTEPNNRYNKRWSDSDDSIPYCPNCGSEDIEESEKCVECGAVKCVDNLMHGWCEDCVKEEAGNMREVFKYGADRTETVELNGVLARAFYQTQIEAILVNHLMNNGDLEKECYDFALDDIHDFAWWLSEHHDK